MSSKRDRELARLRAERQAARKAELAAKRRQRNTALSVGIVLLLVLAAVFAAVTRLTGDDEDEQALTPSPTPSASACTWTPTPQEASRPTTVPPTDPVVATASATITTNRGTVAFRVSPEAPCAGASLASLAEQRFYDDTPCHRLTTAGLFVLQCGDPTGTGTGGPGYQFAEEDLEGATYPRGTVAMAKGSAPATTGSQFFLVYKDSPLPPEYTPVGTITRGLSVLDAVAAGGSQPAGDGAPKLAVQVTSLRTTEAPAATPSGSATTSPATPRATPSR